MRVTLSHDSMIGGDAVNAAANLIELHPSNGKQQYIGELVKKKWVTEEGRGYALMVLLCK